MTDLERVASFSTRHRRDTERLVRERDDAIRTARAHGHSLRAIAAAAGLSPQTVANICAADRSK